MPSTHHRARRTTGVLALGAVLALGTAGCGGDEPAPAGSTSAATPATPGTSPSASRGPSTPAEGPVTTGSGTAGSGTAGAGSGGGSAAPTAGEPGVKSTPITVQGTVSAREGDCLYFTVGDMAESWVLTGRTSGLAPGDQVELTGAVIDTPDPTCRDAMPFDVLSVRRP